MRWAASPGWSTGGCAPGRGVHPAPAAAVGSTLAMYCVVYTLLPLAAGWFYYKIIAKGADLTLAPPAPHPRQGRMSFFMDHGSAR